MITAIIWMLIAICLTAIGSIAKSKSFTAIGATMVLMTSMLVV